MPFLEKIYHPAHQNYQQQKVKINQRIEQMERANSLDASGYIVVQIAKKYYCLPSFHRSS